MTAGTLTITPSTRWLYGSGGIVFGVITNVHYFALIYYSQVLGLSAHLAGLALAIGFVADAVTDPVIGYLSDNTKSRWGRRHPFLYASVLPLALSYYFLWHPPSFVDTDADLFLYLVACNLVLYVSTTMFLVPAFALAAELTSDYEERSRLLSWFYTILSIVSNGVSVVMYAWWLVPTPDIADGVLNPEGYRISGVVCTVLIVVACLVFSLGLRHTIPYIRHHRAAGVVTPGAFYRQVRDVLANPSLRSMVISGILYYAGIGMYAALWVYIYSYFWAFTNEQISLIVIPMALAGLVLPPLMRRLGLGREKKLVGTIGLVGAIVCNIVPITLRLLGWFPENGTEVLFWTMLVTGIFETILFLVFGVCWRSMTADVTEQAELETGFRNEGIITAAVTFASKCSRSLGAVLAGAALTLIAFPKGLGVNETPPDVVFNLGLVYGPVIVSIFVAACYVFNRYSISREQHAATVAILAENAEFPSS